jgi:hypothetical protein
LVVTSDLYEQYAEQFGLRDGDWSPEEAALVSLVDHYRAGIAEAVEQFIESATREM